MDMVVQSIYNFFSEEEFYCNHILLLIKEEHDVTISEYVLILIKCIPYITDRTYKTLQSRIK